MDSDIFKRLEQLQEQVTQLGELARTLAASAPQGADGTDATGCVRVSLGNDGLPRAIQIRNGWNQRIEADRLSAAVMEANDDAINSAMHAWSAELDESFWWRARQDEDGADPNRPRTPTPPAGIARDTSELTEDVLDALQSVRRQQPLAPTVRGGSDRNRHVTVQLGQRGLLSCTIDPRWAARSDGDAITAVVSQALHAAAAVAVPAQVPALDFDRLVGDALATLKDVTQLPRPGGNGR